MPLAEVVEQSDIMILCAPHTVYQELDLSEKIVVDIWDFWSEQLYRKSNSARWLGRPDVSRRPPNREDWCGCGWHRIWPAGARAGFAS